MRATTRRVATKTEAFGVLETNIETSRASPQMILGVRQTNDEEQEKSDKRLIAAVAGRDSFLAEEPM